MRSLFNVAPSVLPVLLAKEKRLCMRLTIQRQREDKKTFPRKHTTNGEHGTRWQIACAFAGLCFAQAQAIDLPATWTESDSFRSLDNIDEREDRLYVMSYAISPEPGNLFAACEESEESFPYRRQKKKKKKTTTNGNGWMKNWSVANWWR